MKSTNYATKDMGKETKGKIVKKAADMLMRRGIEEEECIVLFAYEPEIPKDVLMSQKV